MVPTLISVSLLFLVFHDICRFAEFVSHILFAFAQAWCVNCDEKPEAK